MPDSEKNIAASLTVAVLADSRGLDTYYLNPQYPAGYGIDRVFATQLSYRFRSGETSPAYDAVLIPDHFRAGALQSKILRLALTDPAAVILCDGIWETLLNREKHFQRAEELGRLPVGLFGDESPSNWERAGTVLTELFAEGALDVSPARYRENLDPIVGYFARRRRRVYWLSLPVPPPEHRGGVHFAGNYRPLPGWDLCMQAINEAAEACLSSWGQNVIFLDPLVERIGGADKALLDLWHFTPEFHDLLATDLAERLPRDLADTPLRDRHPSQGAMIAGRTEGWPIVDLGRELADKDIETLRDSLLVVSNSDEARALLSRCHESVVILFPEEV